MIGSIGQAEIDAAAFKLYPTAKNATRRRHCYTPMMAVLHHCARKGWIRAPIVTLPKAAKSVTTYSSASRLEKLLPFCNAKLRRLMVFLPYTGARVSEALRLDWEKDMDLQARTAILRRTKNGKPRTVHLPDPVLIELAAVKAEHRKGKVFDWANYRAVYKPLRRACKLAKVDYLPTHQSGRHTFAAWLRIHAKRDLVGLKNDGGWDSIQSVMRYEHLVPGESVEAVNRLPVVQNVCTQESAAPKRLKRNA